MSAVLGVQIGLVGSLLALVAGEAQELTDKNFDEVVFDSGKTAFVKFLAPW